MIVSDYWLLITEFIKEVSPLLPNLCHHQDYDRLWGQTICQVDPHTTTFHSAQRVLYPEWALEFRGMSKFCIVFPAVHSPDWTSIQNNDVSLLSNCFFLCQSTHVIEKLDLAALWSCEIESLRPASFFEAACWPHAQPAANHLAFQSVGFAQPEGLLANVKNS